MVDLQNGPQQSDTTSDIKSDSYLNINDVEQFLPNLQATKPLPLSREEIIWIIQKDG